MESDYPEEVQEIKKCIYVDDVLLSDYDSQRFKELKGSAIHIFESGGFTLHKWHSNDKDLEEEQRDEQGRKQVANFAGAWKDENSNFK